MHKYLVILLSLAVLPAFGQDASSLPVSGQDASSFSYLRAHFGDPGRHYGSAPLWVWNTDVTEKEIDSALAGFKKNAFGGVFIHPRPGLITEYLSSEWDSLYAYTVKKGKELGLDVWIYDEDSYPSGFAGGHVPDEMPASYNQGQMLHLKKVTVLPEDAAATYFICLKEENGVCRDITNDLSSEKGKTGNYFLFSKVFYEKSPWYGGFSYVDLMVKGVTEKFIDVTMKGYEKAVGAEFGKTVRGIFSDEPNIEVQGSGNIRWTPDLFSTFRQKWGYDLLLHLPSLFEETGDWKQIRHNYYQTLLDLFVDRWSKPYAAYAAGKNLEWTGHYWEHAWPSPNTGPDNMAMYVWPQRPGIDMLFNNFDEVSPNAQFGNVRSVKELASVADQLGKKRTLSETYGGGGWELTFKDMKRLGDWEFVLGINTLNQHLSHMTINGARKYDYPQSFSYHEPWWPYYGSLNRHFTRLSFVLSQGEERNKILVIEPTTSAWMYFSYDKPDAQFRQIGRRFQAFVTNLSRAQVEYDLGSEYIIKDRGSVRDGKLVIGRRAYSTVVLPPGMENLDRPTYRLLQEYVAQGGKLVGSGELQTLDGAASDSLRSFSERAVSKPWVADPEQDQLAQYFTSPDCRIAAIGQGPIGGDLYHQRREFANGQLLFLANSSMLATTKVRVSMKGRRVWRMDTFTGDIQDYPAATGKDRVRGQVNDPINDQVLFDVSIPPAGSQVFFVTGNDEMGAVNATGTRGGAGDAGGAGGKETPLPAGTTRVQRPAANTLMIDFCDVHIGDTLLKDQHVYYATDTLFKHYGFNQGDPWNTSVQYRRNIVDRDTFSTGTPVSITYHFTIDGGVDFSAFRAVVERAGLWNITINGHPVLPEKNKWWLDTSFAVLEIGRYLQPGENLLQLATGTMHVNDEIEPVYLLGDFNLASASKGWFITAPQPLHIGSWKEQGLPMYGQGVRYVKEFRVKTAGQRVAVRLGKWKGTVAAVTVNGRDAGVIAYDPYELDITNYLRAGNNRVEVTVIGSLKNLLGPHHNAPKPGLVSPWQWRGIRRYPAGTEYDTLDYGLLEDFQLIGL